MAHKTVLLINPNPTFLIETSNEPLNLLTLAGILKSQKDINVFIIDGAVTKITKTTLKKTIQKNHITHVGCTSTTAQYPEALKILSWCQQIKKELNLPLLTMIGGVHATILGKKALKDGWDTVCTLEFDLKITKVIKKNLKGLVIGDQVKSQDLDKNPFPARELLNPYTYHKTNQTPTITIMTMRGCPYNCLFCDKTIMGYKPRCRSLENIVAEIKMVQKKWGINHVIFYDDTFNIFHHRVIELCQLLKPLKIKWECNSRVNTINPEQLRVMKKAGYYCVKYGLEAANQRVLKSIRKRITLTQAKNAVLWTKQAGIQAGVYTMFGFPEDNWDSAKDLIKFIKQTNPDRLQLALTIPLPNTDLFKLVVNKMHFQPPTDLSEYYYVGKQGPHTWVKKTKYLNQKEFKNACNWLQKEIKKWHQQSKNKKSITTNIQKN